MKKELSIAKITMPTIKGIFERERLFNQIDCGREKPVICITSPPGSGKTTLIESYISSRKLSNIWYRIDERDKDLSTFFYYMGLAAKKVYRKKTGLPLLTPEYLPSIRIFTMRYFERLFGIMKTPSVIVLDNYHELPSDSELHEVLRDGLSGIPEGITVIIISRQEPPPVYTNLRAINSLHYISYDEIKFRLPEIKEILSYLGKDKIWNEKSIGKIYKLTDGWIAAFVLILERARIGKIDIDFTLSQYVLSDVFNYLAREIFDGLEEQIRIFLLKSAFLPEMTGVMAKELTGYADAEPILSNLTRNHYFTECLHQKEPLYQYHPLFKEFLLVRAKDSFSEREILDLRRSAAMLLEKSGQVELAMELYLLSGEFEAAVWLLCQSAPAMIKQGRYQTIKMWLDGFPEDVLKQMPYLLYWSGICLMPFNPPSSLIQLERSFDIFKTQNDRVGLFLSWAGITQVFLHLSHNFQPLDRWISELENILKADPSFPSEDIEANVTVGMFLAMVFRQPHHPAIEFWEKKILVLLQSDYDIELGILALAVLLSYYVHTGQMIKSEHQVNLCGQNMQSQNLSPFTLIMLKTMFAMFYLLTPNFEIAMKHIEEGLKLAEDSGIHIWDFHLLIYKLGAALFIEDLDTASALIQNMEMSYLERARNMDKGFFLNFVSWDALLRKDLSRALFYSDKEEGFLSELGMPFAYADYLKSKSIILHELGMDEAALEHLSLFHSFAGNMKFHVLEFDAYALEAYIYLKQGRDDLSIEPLRKAMATGGKYNIMNFPWWQPKVMSSICMKSLTEGIETEYAARLIRNRNLLPEKNSVSLESWPWALRIYTLGKFDLISNDKPVQFSQKLQQKPLAMLKALIALGGIDVREGIITDLLWPDADGDMGHKSFATTLHRLRKLTGHDNAIQLRGGRLTLDSRYCYVDAWAFEQIFLQAETAANIEEEKRLLQNAVKLYNGHFLQADDNISCSPNIREKLREKYVNAIMRIGTYSENNGDPAEAVTIYNNGLNLVQEAEILYQRLMLFYQHTGQKTEAKKVYDRCKSSLAAIGQQPSVKTESIYMALQTI